MRPIRLTMRAFGPYAGEETVDFGALAGRTFFLIHGPTGAGKSSILDAICFALYGDTSGAEREARQMRSDHADPKVTTEVVFDFALGDDVYRVARKPEHERAKLRGEGTTTQLAEATLWRRTGCDERDEGTVVESKTSRVTNAIEHLTGFTASEFRQVVMLPQGQFRRLLMADSNEREAILETLFKTDLYRHIQERLKAARKQVESEQGGIDARKAALLEQSQAEGRKDLVDRKGRLEAELAELAAKVDATRLQHQSAVDELNAARKLASDLDELATCKQRIDALSAQQASIEASRQALERARRAAPLRPLLARRDEAIENERAMRAAAEVAAEKHDRAAERDRNAQDVELAAQEQHPERESTRSELARLRSLAGKATALAEAMSARDRKQEVLAQLRQRLESGTRSIDDLEARGKRAVERQTDAKVLAAQVEARTSQRDAARELLGTREKLDAARRRSAEILGEAARHGEALTAADERLRVERDALRRLREQWSAGQASVLARTLEDGEPCPVCGSPKHPSPATALVDVPDLGQIEEQETRCAAIENEIEGVQEQLQSARAKLQSVEDATADLTERLGERVHATSDALTAEVRAAEEVLETAKRARGSIEAIDAERSEIAAALASARTSREQDARARDEHAQALAVAVAAIEQLEREIPESLRDADALAEAIAAATRALETLENALKAAADERREAAAALAAAVAARQAAQQNAHQATRQSQQAIERFADALRTANIADEDALRSALADEATVDALEADIGRFDAALATAMAERERLEAIVAGRDRPDLEATSTRATELGREYEDAVRRQTGCGNDLRRLGEELATLDSLERKAAMLQERYGVVGRIAALADGTNAHGIPFHRFVLAALLDDVLRAATLRLTVMSNNRYLLQRSSDRGSKRRTTGLELEVYDSYTGTARPVATLSGGESFLASLSLALGLADVVQAYSGGIRLDAIFVDEGFGTLDPESLDLALRALVDLQQGGRLVGIISHVPELKERIDARLEVTATRRGSRARFVVA